MLTSSETRFCSSRHIVGVIAPVLALFVTPQVADAQTCPSSTTTWTVSGTLGSGQSTGYLPTNIQACELLSVQLTISAPSGISWSLAYYQDPPAPTALLSEGEICGSSCTYTLPEDLNGKYPATLGLYSRPSLVRLRNGFSYNQATYSLTFTRTPRPGYNTGGTDFDTATLLPMGLTTVKATLSPSENGPNTGSGQFFRLTLPQGGMLSLSGFAHRWFGFNSGLSVKLYDANRQQLQLLVNSMASAPDADPFSSPIFVNNGATPAQFYLKIASGAYLLHDVVMRVDATSSTLNSLTLKLDAFIKYEWIFHPSFVDLIFEGDNRGFQVLGRRIPVSDAVRSPQPSSQ